MTGPSSLPESTYAVLGLVDKVPDSSGYDLAAVASLSLSYFWPVSRTLLYRELERLTDLGWVEATRVEQTHAPNKWTYRTTPAGRAALTEWLRRQPETLGSTRNPVLLRLFFAHRMSNSRITSLLGAYRAQLQIELDQLEAIVEKLESIAEPAPALVASSPNTASPPPAPAWNGPSTPNDNSHGARARDPGSPARPDR